MDCFHTGLCGKAVFQFSSTRRYRQGLLQENSDDIVVFDLLSRRASDAHGGERVVLAFLR
jgi:hypothetical protein